jgi:hypothetical protein
VTDKYFNVPLGARINDVTPAASDASDFISVRVTTSATGANKMEVKKALQAVMDRIARENWPPA